MNKKPKHLKKLAALNLRVDDDTLKRIDRLARADFEARSEVVRRALDAGLKQLERKG
ncbi:MAG TPA: ribbon-helix-helix protein, CopG family [Verrucomicrobiae bacterium]|jgi:predicted transcriptional regulator|nr:ribbon-helix-helix protein, CopG family [Verrucomicrobiae bacterium]